MKYFTIASSFFTVLVCLHAPVQAQQPHRDAQKKDIPTIAHEANGAIVSIVMSDKDGRPISQGSGFLISHNGYVVTNYHVISHGTSAIAKRPDGAFFVLDGVLAFDKNRDIAIVKAHGADFHTVALGDSDKLQVGEEVVAIGNPLSLESTVSNGIVSGIRTLEKEGGSFLQITAPISPGSSGGPLFDMAGDVVGITTSGLTDAENLNFAIPINEVKPLFHLKSSRVSNFPDEAEAGERTDQGAPALKVDQSVIERKEKELQVDLSILEENIKTGLTMALLAPGASFPQRDTSKRRDQEWMPEFDYKKEALLLNSGSGHAIVCPIGSKMTDCRDVFAPADVQARLSMEALREDLENVRNVPKDKSNTILDGAENGIWTLWSEEETLYCVMHPEAQYIDLTDTLQSCTRGQK
jgi:hypothetical protein